jgi:hypothetical protein
MSQKLSLKKALKGVIFLAAFLAMTGCYSLKSVSVTRIPAERKILVIHAEESSWTTTGYAIADGILTANIGAGSIKLKKDNSAHIYVAPLSAVTIDGQTLTVPVRNIAKADFSDLDFADTIGFGALWALIIMTVLVFFS